MLPRGSGWKIWPTTHVAPDQQELVAAYFRCEHDEKSGLQDFMEVLQQSKGTLESILSCSV